MVRTVGLGRLTVPTFLSHSSSLVYHFPNIFPHIHQFPLFLPLSRFPFFSLFLLTLCFSHFFNLLLFSTIFHNLSTVFWSRRRVFLASFVLDEATPTHTILRRMFLMQPVSAHFQSQDACTPRHGLIRVYFRAKKRVLLGRELL